MAGLDKLQALSERSTEAEKVVAWGEALEGVSEAIEAMHKAPRPEGDGEAFAQTFRANRIMFEAAFNQLVDSLTDRGPECN